MIEKSECVGCKTHFQEGTKLPPEGITIELKRYQIPIKDQKHKWVLLKTICSFLNSKGGTIFIGADDSTGEVRGVSASRKEQDDFKISISQLIERIQPKLDLTHKEDIIVQFVPVLSKGKFLGKYLIKIIVRQGDPSQVYCFNQKLQLQAGNDKGKVQQYQIVYSYIRLNAASTKQYKGYELVQLVKNRASHPPKLHCCFHDNCNPEPPNLNIQILKIGFSRIFNPDYRENLQNWFQRYLQQLGIVNQSISFDIQNSMIVIEMFSKPEFDKVQIFISKNIQQLNTFLQGRCKFVRKDNFLDCILYQNQVPKQKQPQIKIKQGSNGQNSNEKSKKYVKKQKIGKKYFDQDDFDETQAIEQKKQVSQQEIKKPKSDKRDLQNKKQGMMKKQSKKQPQVKSQKFIKQPQQKSKPTQQITKHKQIGKRHSFAFTHINPKQKDELVKYLDSLYKCQKNFETHKNTVEVFFENEKKLHKFLQKVGHAEQRLNYYGFKNQIKMGINTGIIEIRNFDNSRGKQLKFYLKNLIGKDLTHIELIHQGRQTFMNLLLSPPNASIWLDRILEERLVQQFQIPGAQKGNKAKIKVYLVCQNPFQMFNEIQYMFMP